MTAPLDEKAVELAAREIAANDWSVDSNMTKREWQDARWIYHRDDAEAAIRAYLAASPSPSEMEVVEGLLSNGQPLVTLSQAQSALAAMRADNQDLLAAADADAFTISNLSDQVLRLTEELLRMQMALVGWVNVAEMLADEPSMEAHFHDIADATQNEVEAARTTLQKEQTE